MSVRVNLLPEATKQRGRDNRQRLAVGAAAAVVALALGGVWLWSSGQVRQAEERLATEQAVTADLRGEEAELVAFRDLANRRDRVDDVLIATMAGEVSMAGVLQDLAAVMPEDAQFDALALNLQPPAGDAADLVGTLTITGRTLTSHAPGVERILLSLDKVSAFGQLFLNSSTLDTEAEDPIATFSVDGAIRAGSRTDRYADGLPGELR